MISKKFRYNFFKTYNINAINIPSKQAIVKIASTSGDRDILYSYVANENDHTVAIDFL